MDNKERTRSMERLEVIAEKICQLKEEDVNYVSGVMDGMLIRASIEQKKKAS